MFNRILRRLREIRCFWLHERTIQEVRFKDGIILWDMGFYIGCKKCDLWESIKHHTKPNT
jgi:hypothetical protein